MNLDNPKWHVVRDHMKLGQFIQDLCNKKGATFLSFEAHTIPKMLKTDNPFFGQIYKVVIVNGVINHNYESNVNKARKKEGNTPDFVAKDRAWGERIGKTPLIAYKGEIYLSFRPLHTAPAKYYWNSGSPLTLVELEGLDGFLVNPEDPNVRQGISSPPGVLERDYNLKNIKKVRFSNKEVKIEA
jgi:hypothetical protein